MKKKNIEKYERYALIIIVIASIILLSASVYPSTKSIVPINGLSAPPSFIITRSMINSYTSSATPLTATNGETFSIAGEQATNISYVGTPLTATFSVPVTNVTSTISTTTISTQCVPLVILLTNSTNTLMKEGTVVSVSSSPYTASISYTPTTTGIYIFGASCQTSTATYNISSNTWSAWSAPINQSQKFAVKVETPATPPPPPQFNLSSFINSIISSISNFLKSLGI